MIVGKYKVVEIIERIFEDILINRSKYLRILIRDSHVPEENRINRSQRKRRHDQIGADADGFFVCLPPKRWKDRFFHDLNKLQGEIICLLYHDN